MTRPLKQNSYHNRTGRWKGQLRTAIEKVLIVHIMWVSKNKMCSRTWRQSVAIGVSA